MSEFSKPGDYERWMGRWSARLAPAFVDFARLSKGASILDVGSGTGVLAITLLSRVDDATVIGVEPSASYVAHCRERVYGERIAFKQGDASDLPFADDCFDATLSLLILQELEDAPKAVAEMSRVTKSGGIVAASQWNFETGMPMLALFWEAVIETIGTENARRAAANCMLVDYPNGAALSRLWDQAGLLQVEMHLQEIEMEFESFDDYWTPFLSGVTPTASYAQTLREDERSSLQACLRQKLGVGSRDAGFTLNSQAWAVRGLVPGES